MSEVRLCAWLLLFALLIRGGVLLLTPNALTVDTDGYRRLAENLVTHGTLGDGERPSAFRPPLYPLLLGGCVAMGSDSRVAIGVLHVVLGVATVAMVLLLGRWWELSRRASGLAAMLVACDPILLMWSTQVMTETLAAFLTTAGLVAFTWTAQHPTARRAALAGAVFALGALCRPALLLWAVAAAGLLLFGRPRPRWSGATGEMESHAKQEDRHSCLSKPASSTHTTTDRNVCPPGFAGLLSGALAFILGMALLLAPWTIRNQLDFGKPIVTTTHGGYTLLLGNNPEFYRWLHEGSWGSVWWSKQFDADWDRRKPHGEVEADRAAYREAWRNIRDEPVAFAEACCVRLGRFWSPLPHQITPDETSLRRLSRWGVAAWYIIEFALACLLGTCCRHETPRHCNGGGASPSALGWSAGLLLVLCLTAAHAVYWTDMRMRAPVMPVVALAAAVGVFGAIRPRNRYPMTTTSLKFLQSWLPPPLQ